MLLTERRDRVLVGLLAIDVFIVGLVASVFVESFYILVERLELLSVVQHHTRLIFVELDRGEWSKILYSDGVVRTNGADRLALDILHALCYIYGFHSDAIGHVIVKARLRGVEFHVGFLVLVGKLGRVHAVLNIGILVFTIVNHVLAHVLDGNVLDARSRNLDEFLQILWRELR